MDVMKQLHSILAPPPVPAIRARPATNQPETSAVPSFAATLAEAGLKPSRPAPAVVDAVPIEPESDEELPVRDTLATLTDKITERKAEEPEADFEARGPAVSTPAPLAAGTVTVDAPAAPRPSLLPPFGIQWQPVALRGTGASGHGVAGTDEAMANHLAAKHEQYADPARFGVKLNLEGLMFLDAVDKGYVPNTPEGLGTLLGYLGKGSMGPDARPLQMTEYFRQFFATARATGMA